MNRIRRLALASALLIAPAAVVLTSAPAHADPNPLACPAGYPDGSYCVTDPTTGRVIFDVVPEQDPATCLLSVTIGGQVYCLVEHP
jgi:hypothetical protein